MWNEPIVLFLVVMHSEFTLEDVYRYARVLVTLLKIELVWGFLQIYNYLQSGESEDIKGTFYHNAEQYQAFVLIGVFYLLGKLELPDNPRKNRHKLAIVAILFLVLLIDNKASWITTGLTLAYLLLKMPALTQQVRLNAKYVWAFAGIVAFGYFVVVSTSNSIEKYDRVFEAWQTGNFLNIGKIKAYGDVLEAYGENFHMVFVGAGLGTFYSRAAWQFLPPTIKDIYSGPLAPKENAIYSESNSMGGVINPVAHIEPFYRQFFRTRKIFPVFSGTIDQPSSSYVSLLGEAGVIAALLYISIYRTILKRLRPLLPIVKSDPRIFPFAVATIGFFVYMVLMGTYNFWLEDARLATILWSMVPMLLKYAELRGDEPAFAGFFQTRGAGVRTLQAQGNVPARRRGSEVPALRYAP